MHKSNNTAIMLRAYRKQNGRGDRHVAAGIAFDAGLSTMRRAYSVRCS